MTIKEDIYPIEFKAWCGGIDTLETIREKGKEEEFNQLCEDIFPDGATDTGFNDFLWFDSDCIFEALGIPVDE